MSANKTDQDSDNLAKKAIEELNCNNYFSDYIACLKKNQEKRNYKGIDFNINSRLCNING